MQGPRTSRPKSLLSQPELVVSVLAVRTSIRLFSPLLVKARQYDVLLQRFDSQIMGQGGDKWVNSGDRWIEKYSVNGVRL